MKTTARTMLTFARACEAKWSRALCFAFGHKWTYLQPTGRFARTAVAINPRYTVPVVAPEMARKRSDHCLRCGKAAKHLGAGAKDVRI